MVGEVNENLDFTSKRIIHFLYLRRSDDCCKPGLQLGGQPLRIVAIQGNFQIQLPGENKCCYFFIDPVITEVTTKVDTQKATQCFLLELAINCKLHTTVLSLNLSCGLFRTKIFQ